MNELDKAVAEWSESMKEFQRLAKQYRRIVDPETRFKDNGFMITPIK